MITIVPYNIAWPQEFKAIGEELKIALKEKAIGIHHIGSTSVPGLAAKNVIDVQVTVEKLNDEIIAPLQAIGYKHLPHITGDHQPKGEELTPEQLQKMFFKRTDRDINLHIRVQGAFNQQYPILFRDYLRNNPLAANAYAEIKKQLATYFPENLQAYYDIKDPVCDAIMAGAYEWSKAVGWKISLSDI